MKVEKGEGENPAPGREASPEGRLTADAPDVSFPAVLRVEKVVAGGMGFGRIGGLAVFIPLGAPGDLVEVEAARRMPDYVVARITRIVEASPARREAPCIYFPACGGCQWQHLPYEAQLEAKEGILADAFRRIGRFQDVHAAPIVPSPREFNYRHRVQLKVLTGGGSMRWGFFGADSHRLVDIRRCLISHDSINALLPDLDRFVEGLGLRPSVLGTVELNVDGTGRRVEFILHPRRRKFELPPHGRRFIHRAGDGTELDISVVSATQVRKLPVTMGDFTFPSGSLTLSSGAGVFSQNNLSLNPRLVRTVVELAEPTPADTVADIYCGVGNYSIPLAMSAGRVVAVENNRRACLFGEANARALGLTNISFIQKTAREALAELPAGLRTVVLNPPRVGAADIMADIACLAPARVVYVSCNPATLARDLAVLAGTGYRLDRLAPFDMFPQTHHLETVALMVKD
jgi:23S rRNA (uracil1939-C5)-methyltransferase